jgi:hypothetical protein
MPPPGIISSLNGALPTQYDPGWQSYTDLSVEQIAAFQAFPQDLTKYIGIRRWQTEINAWPAGSKPAYITLPTVAANPTISGMQLATDALSQQRIAALKQAIDNGAVAPSAIQRVPFLAVNGVYQLTASDVTALYSYVVRYVQATYSVAATLLAQVNATPQTLTTRAPVDAAFAAIIVQ